MDDTNIIDLAQASKANSKPAEPEHPPYHNYLLTFNDHLGDPDFTKNATGFCAFGPGWVAIMQGPGEVQLLAYEKNLKSVEIVNDTVEVLSVRVPKT